jgi:hypothetical protein
MPEMGDGRYLHPLHAITKVSQLAGRVIDRNQGVAEQSFAWAQQLDQELEELWKKLDPAWLDYSELLADAETNAAELRERLMGQICFHQIRVYLHLPFMLKSASNSAYNFSRTACLNGSREVLRLYQALRNGAVQPLYECKAIDFIGFTAAVLIQIGLLNFGMSAKFPASPQEIEGDIRLIEISIDIFRRASSEKGGKVALQSAQVLEKMMMKFRGGVVDHDGCVGDVDFVIPYFGTISIKRGDKQVRQIDMPKPAPYSPSPSVMTTRSPAQYTPTSEKPSTVGSGSDLFSHPTQSLNHTPKTSISAGSNPTSSAFTFAAEPSPFATYNGFYNFDNLDASGVNANVNATLLNDDSMSNFPLPTNNFSWQHMPMDIDQDWSWFLNDNQTQQQQPGVAGVGAAAAAPMGDVFGVNGFTGFG